MKRTHIAAIVAVLALSLLAVSAKKGVEFRIGAYRTQPGLLNTTPFIVITHDDNDVSLYLNPLEVHVGERESVKQARELAALDEIKQGLMKKLDLIRERAIFGNK